MVRSRARTATARRGSPRASGGGPSTPVLWDRWVVFSPRERGWSPPPCTVTYNHDVLPARAGVVRVDPRPWRTGQRSPRASGGGPAVPGGKQPEPMFSPRERGWSGVGPGPGAVPRVLPARAGVVRPYGVLGSPCLSSPRASGGGPQFAVTYAVMPPFSPRERGWSADRPTRLALAPVLPARAGVLLERQAAGSPPPPFSPRERGWSDRRDQGPSQQGVLPARAGVVRGRSARPSGSSRSPRASGGGPHLRTYR